MYAEKSARCRRGVKLSSQKEAAPNDQIDDYLRHLLDNAGFRTVFESANDPMMVIDNKGRIVEVNERLAAISGYAKEGFNGKKLKALAGIFTGKVPRRRPVIFCGIRLVLTSPLLKSSLSGKTAPPPPLKSTPGRCSRSA
jgi:hypothetical protein